MSDLWDLFVGRAVLLAAKDSISLEDIAKSELVRIYKDLSKIHQTDTPEELMAKLGIEY